MCVAGKDLHILNSLVFPMHDSLAVWSVRIFVFLSCCNAIERDSSQIQRHGNSAEISSFRFDYICYLGLGT